MAFTSLLYDSCATKKRTEESTGILSYLMDPNKYYNCNPCRIDLGTTGGNQVSLYDGNLVDLDSDLSGRTRPASLCPSSKYLPGTIIQGRDTYNCAPGTTGEGLPCGDSKTMQQKLVHLPTCKLVQYKPRVDTVGYELNFPPCATVGNTPKPTKIKKRKNPYMPIEWQGQQGAKELARY